MTGGPEFRLRLAFLSRVLTKEASYLRTTDERLFAVPLTLEMIGRLEDDPSLSERMDAFVARFGRLQDTIGDKLLPALLAAAGERPGAFLDNLDRAERLGWVVSADDWMTMRQLRNQMVHEYIEDPVLLIDALTAGHGFVPHLLAAAARLTEEASRRSAGRG